MDRVGQDTKVTFEGFQAQDVGEMALVLPITAHGDARITSQDLPRGEKRRMISAIVTDASAHHRDSGSRVRRREQDCRCSLFRYAEL
jgi:hypothetical protein